MLLMFTLVVKVEVAESRGAEYISVLGYENVVPSVSLSHYL